MHRLSKRVFDLVWDYRARDGVCDGRGGAEYRRVLAEWQRCGTVEPPHLFIRRRANLLSDGSESPEVLPRP